MTTHVADRKHLQKHYFALILLSSIMTLLLVIGQTPSVLHSQSPTKTPTASPTVSSRFGAVEAYYRPEDAAEAGVGWERIIFEWRYFQPNGPDDWDTSHMQDKWFSDAQRDGRMVVGLLKNAPHWATGSDLLGAPSQGLDLPIDDENNYWAAFVKKVTQYYGEKWNIHHWIIYNEPDIRPEDTNFFEFAGGVEDYYKVLKVAYKAAHAADPKAVIHLAGLTFWQDVINNRDLYLERLIRVAINDPEARANHLFFDVMTVHVFSGTDWVRRITQQSQSLPTSFGFPHPVWIDEMNVRVTMDGKLPIRGKTADQPDISLDEQASFIVQGSAIALSLGVEKIAIYRLYDDNVSDGYEAWGLVRGDGSRRPGYFALKTVIHYFEGVTNVQRFSQYGISLVTMRRGNQTVYVIWNETSGLLDVRVKAFDSKTSAPLILPDGQEETIPVSPDNGGIYALSLPPCAEPCMVQGAPRIIVQTGTPAAVWAVVDGKPARIN